MKIRTRTAMYKAIICHTKSNLNARWKWTNTWHELTRGLNRRLASSDSWLQKNVPKMGTLVIKGLNILAETLHFGNFPLKVVFHNTGSHDWYLKWNHVQWVSICTEVKLGAMGAWPRSHTRAHTLWLIDCTQEFII